MMAALNTLTTFYGVNQSAEGKRGSAGGNTLEARRSLRADLEANSVILSRKFMSQLTQLQQVRGHCLVNVRVCSCAVSACMFLILPPDYAASWRDPELCPKYTPDMLAG